MIYKNEFLYFILSLAISIGFAIDGSLPSSQHENAVYLNLKGQSRSVRFDDIQFKERTSDTAKAQSRSTPLPDEAIPDYLSMSENNYESMIADYDFGYQMKPIEDPRIINIEKKQTLNSERLNTLTTKSKDMSRKISISSRMPYGYSNGKISNARGMYTTRDVSKDNLFNTQTTRRYLTDILIISPVKRDYTGHAPAEITHSTANYIKRQSEQPSTSKHSYELSNKIHTTQEYSQGQSSKIKTLKKKSTVPSNNINIKSKNSDSLSTSKHAIPESYTKETSGYTTQEYSKELLITTHGSRKHSQKTFSTNSKNQKLLPSDHFNTPGPMKLNTVYYENRHSDLVSPSSTDRVKQAQNSKLNQNTINPLTIPNSVKNDTVMNSNAVPMDDKNKIYANKTTNIRDYETVTKMVTSIKDSHTLNNSAKSSDQPKWTNSLHYTNDDKEENKHNPNYSITTTNFNLGGVHSKKHNQTPISHLREMQKATSKSIRASTTNDRQENGKPPKEEINFHSTTVASINTHNLSYISTLLPLNADKLAFLESDSTINYNNSNSKSFSPYWSTESIYQKPNPSPRRVEISENDVVDIFWMCPPSNEVKDPKKYEWFRVSNTIRYRELLSSMIDTTAKKSVLQIKGANAKNEGRYICTIKKSNPFNFTEMYFYQIIVLHSKWINIGMTSVVSLYSNQKAIINCPYGDIIKNNVKTSGFCCSSRLTIVENIANSIKDVYRCSNSDKVTIKLPAIDSSNNCSLSLLACNYTMTKNQANETSYNVKPTIKDFNKCNFNNDNQSAINRWIPKKCSGKIFIRFYFDNLKNKCLPFETSICNEDYYSFESLKKCDEACITISSDLHSCFHPQNVDMTYNCSNLELKGTYMASYDIENNVCKWFYHCGDFSLSKNVFKSISKCKNVCEDNERQIRRESFKVCDSPTNNNNSSVQYVTQRWTFNKELRKCELTTVNINSEPVYLYFTKKKRCETICKRIDDEICRSRPENGVCSTQKIKWYFDIQSKRCIRILDGGCGSSLNRFDSKLSCEETCQKLLDKMISSVTNIPMTIAKTDLNLHSTVTTSSQTKSTKVASKDPIRRRFHRRINIQKLKSTRLISTSTERSTPRKYISPIDSEIDFDPCFKDAIKGSCDYGFQRSNYQMIRYSFNSQTGRCYKISFSGCKSGENLFDDANDCKSACEFRLHRSLKSPSCQHPYSEKCIAPDDSKKQDRLKRYFFFPSTAECVPFTSVDTPHCINQYFISVEQCKQVCAPKPPMEHMLQNRCFGKIVLSDHSCSIDEKIYLWFYLSVINQCLQYSTCPVEVEGNAFHTKLDCESACRASNILTVCDLPMDNGRGLVSKSRYYYDSQVRKCRLFYYKGSLGNLNRFKTKKECEKACSDIVGNSDSLKYSSLVSISNHPKDYKGTITNEGWLNKVSDKEYCYDPHRYGGCNTDNSQIFMKKYYYDAYRKQCEPYMFSGCGSISRNSFDSVYICDKMCTERIAKTTSSLCSQKVAKCTESQWVYWMYNPERGVCEPFSSCIKKSEDQFFFADEQKCLQLCAPSLPLKKDFFDICHLPPTISRNCSKFSERWHYEDTTRSCSLTSGCEHYGNNFPSKVSCMAACEPTQLKDVCKLPVDKGPCNDNETTKFYFDWKSQKCKAFSYGGCLGNRNRFHTMIDCEQTCTNKNSCNFKFNITKCKNPNKYSSVSHLYFYDTNENQCKLIGSSICGDPTQLFSTIENCNNACVLPVESQLIIYQRRQNLNNLPYGRCSDSLKFNNYPLCTKSDEWLPRFFYDKDRDQCTFFYYNGCNGTEDRGNRFSLISQCENNCRNTKITTESKSSSIVIETMTTRKIVKKSGFCPGSNNLCSGIQEMYVKCESDADCRGSWKCCFCEIDESIKSVCIEPLGCMATKYGCCADGMTVATDDSHSQCTHQRARIVSDLEEVIYNEPEEDLILNCYVSGDPKPNITWIYHGNSTLRYDVDSKWDLVHPLWSGFMKISAAQYTPGLWSCQSNNEGGWDEKEFYIRSSNIEVGFVKVFAPLSNDSSLINAILNSKVILHCPIYGIPRPSITWFYNRIPVNDSFQSISIFNRQLQIKSVQYLHDGIWTCHGENKINVISYNIKLRIREPLKIYPPPMGTRIKVNYGQKIVILCDVRIDGNKWINWFWKKDKTLVKINSTLENDSRILIISSFQREQYGSYICEAFDKFNRDMIKFTIAPYSYDDIVVNPSGTLFIGMTVTLTCPIKSSENNLQIQWKKDDVDMDKRSINLEILLKSKSDSGFYSCQHTSERYLTYLFILDKSLDL